MQIAECWVEVPALRATETAQRSRCIRAAQVPPLSHRRSRLKESRSSSAAPILSADHLRIEYRSRHETVVAAEDVTLTLPRGGCVALVGESGSGKTSIARAIAGLQPLTSGVITLDGAQLPALARARSREQRRRVQMIFQNPADSLNPKVSVRDAVAWPARSLLGLSRRDANAEAARLIEQVRLPAATLDRYPMELSGGERQRVGIARALAPRPDAIICDEITSALDVSVQAAVLALLDELRSELGLAMLFITHDLGVVAAIADEVVVLEAGQVREAGPIAEVLRSPAHPYTRRLLEAAPSISHAIADGNQEGEVVSRS
jgi:peptide/nickel transport system ATP-binding protein